jgi:hypothetical protein
LKKIFIQHNLKIMLGIGLLALYLGVLQLESVRLDRSVSQSPNKIKSTAGRIEFDDQSTDEVNVLGARVGIGTSTPATTLDVLGAHVSTIGVAQFKGTGQFGYVTLDTTTSGSSALSGFIFKNGGTKIGEISSDDSSMFIYNNLFGGGAEPVIAATSTGRVGIGSGAGAATKLHVIDTAEQMRLGYDVSNYSSFTTTSTGDLTIAPTGGDTSVTGAFDISGLTLNTDADSRVGGATIATSVTKNSTLTRTFYGVNITPTINTGGSNTNTTFNALNVTTTETSTTGTTLNLLRLASGSTQRLAVTSGGNFQSIKRSICI